MQTMQKEDAGLLIYTPSKDEKTWKAILFFLDIDGEVAPNQYLFSSADIRRALIKYDNM